MFRQTVHGLNERKMLKNVAVTSLNETVFVLVSAKMHRWGFRLDGQSSLKWLIAHLNYSR